MSFRQILIMNKVRMSTKNNQLVIVKDEVESNIPLDEISIVVCESTETYITTRTLVELSRRNIVMLFCDTAHMPVCFTLPINQHYRINEVLNMQISQTKESHSFVWERLLKAKIKNARNVLTHVGNSDHAIELLMEYESEIEGHDDINREGIAAKVFFSYMYGSGFTRDQDDPINTALNYGYAVLRSAITRTLCTFGFNTSLGIHHDSNLNAVNLSYDLIEPYRHLIDYYVYKHLHKFEEDLETSSRREIVHLLNAKVMVKEKKYTVLYSIELLVKSYLNYIEYGVEDFAIPEIIPIDFEKLYEEL